MFMFVCGFALGALFVAVSYAFAEMIGEEDNTWKL